MIHNNVNISDGNWDQDASGFGEQWRIQHKPGSNCDHFQK